MNITVQDQEYLEKKTTNQSRYQTKADEKHQGLVQKSKKRIVGSEPLHDNTPITVSNNKTKKGKSW